MNANQRLHEALTQLANFHNLCFLRRVKASITYDENSGFQLVDFARLENSPKGSGAVVLKALCDIADIIDAYISLEVAGSEPELHRYYGRFGFKLMAPPDQGFLTTMIRQPVKCDNVTRLSVFSRSI